MKEFDIVGLQARDVTTNFVMAINGAFFVNHKIGVKASTYDIELGKQNIQTASYIYINSLKEIINKYDSGKGTQVTQAQLNSIAVQLIQKANRAIATGIGNGAALTLGNKAHGGMGQLVAKVSQTLDLSVKDSAGRTWKNPSKLVQTIVRDVAYQSAVEKEIAKIYTQSLMHFQVNGERYAVSQFDSVRSKLFHPNSNNLPEQVHV